MRFGQLVRVRVEVSRGGRVKRRSDGRFHYVSPWPAPFAYGCAPDAPLAGDGDAQDAILLGVDAPAGAVVEGWLVGRVAVVDDGLADDKWIVCAHRRPTPDEVRSVERFFRRYALGKGLLARWRGGQGVRVGAIDWEPDPAS